MYVSVNMQGQGTPSTEVGIHIFCVRYEDPLGLYDRRIQTFGVPRATEVFAETL